MALTLVIVYNLAVALPHPDAHPLDEVAYTKKFAQFNFSQTFSHKNCASTCPICLIAT